LNRLPTPAANYGEGECASKSMKMIRLIGVGIVPAVPAKDLKIGDRIMRNNGYIYKILNIISNRSGKSVTLVIEGKNKAEKGRIYQRNFLNATLVAKLGLPETPR
jgi:hypothetical protein